MKFAGFLKGHVKLEITGFKEVTVCWWSLHGEGTVFSFADSNAIDLLAYRKLSDSHRFIINKKKRCVWASKVLLLLW